MGWFNWVVLAEEIAEPEDDDGSEMNDRQAADFCGITSREWRRTRHAGHVDACEEGLLDERIENKNRQGKSWWW
jgi:hypothetical protein